MKLVATNIYSFAHLRESGLTYVDKAYALFVMTLGEVDARFFMARPRQFGKSLAISTLKCLFEGPCELFQGFAIWVKWHWSEKCLSATETDVSEVVE